MAMFYPDHEGVEVHMLRLGNHIATGGAELNDIRRFHEAVPVPEPQAWYETWQRMADSLKERGEEAMAHGHKVTARECWLKASNYYREANFYLGHNDPLKRETYIASRDCFQRAMKILDVRMEKVEVPWRGKTLPGYITFPAGPGPHPAVAFIGGADATKEELYFSGGRRLVNRGFVVLSIDGPGQGESRMLRDLLATPEWDSLAAPIFQALAERPEVDSNRIGLLGISMAGFYAPMIASAGEPFKCLATWGACFDVLEDLYEFSPGIRRQLEGITNTTAETAPGVLAAFNLREAAPKINIPVLICHGDADALVRPEAGPKTAAALKTEHTLKMFHGAVHCMYDRPGEAIPVMMDWLEEHLA